MLSSFFVDVVEWFRGLGGRRSVPSVHGFHRPAAPPRLEVLEDRCLLSNTTTIPAFADIPPIVAYPDVLMALQSKGNPALAFVGDSINFGYAYGEGAPVWATLMAPLHAADYAIPGQTTQSLLFQFSLGQLAGINPLVVVLNIGGNNLLEGDTPQATAAGVLADVATIHQYLPQSQVLVLGVLPGKESPTDPYRLAGTQTDALVSQMLAGDPHATFVSIGSVFLQPDGTISDSVMYDFLHPTILGYLDMTEALLPVIQQTIVPGAPGSSGQSGSSGLSSLSGPPTLPTLPASPAPPPVQQTPIMSS
jgi:lysophospholipase L1-like esterase